MLINVPIRFYGDINRGIEITSSKTEAWLLEKFKSWVATNPPPVFPPLPVFDPSVDYSDPTIPLPSFEFPPELMWNMEDYHDLVFTWDTVLGISTIHCPTVTNEYHRDFILSEVVRRTDDWLVKIPA